MSMKLARLAGSVALVATFALAASPASAADKAMVRVLHASPDAPVVDVYVNGDKVGGPLAGLAFGDLSAYVALPAGAYDLKVCAAADPSVCPIVANGVALAAGTHYTIAAANALASIEAQVITDDPAPTSTKAQVRVVHFSADTPAVDVLTQDGATTVVENLAYPNATDYLTLDPGSYDLKVCANADHTTCPLDPAALKLQAGRSYSVFAVGALTADPSTLTAVVAVDAVAAPATDTPATDVLRTATAANPTSGAWVLLIGAGLISLILAARFGFRHVDR